VSEPAPSAPPVRASAREAAKQETREALLQAAMAEFAEKGLDVPSLDAICARAGYTRGAFYVHFRDRDELVAGVMERVMGALVDLVLGTDGRGDLAGSIERYTALAARGILDTGATPAPELPGLPTGVPFHQILAACQREEGTRARMVAVLARAGERLAATAAADQRAGRLRTEVEPRPLAALLLLLALGVRAAADLRLPLDVAASRDALIRLLGPAGEPG
jgi:TetR/AcrR family transcriptional regulator, transcriptional repressor for nem operon